MFHPSLRASQTVKLEFPLSIADEAGAAYTQEPYSHLTALWHVEHVFLNGVTAPKAVLYPPNITGQKFDGIVRAPLQEVVVRQEPVMFGLPFEATTRLQIRPDGSMGLPPNGGASVDGDWVRNVGLTRDTNKTVLTVYIRATYFNKATGDTVLGDVHDADVEIIREAIRAHRATVRMKRELTHAP